MEGNYIKQLEITHLWSKYDFSWKNMHHDVNILVGMNGSGKSTFIHIIQAFLTQNESLFERIEVKKAEMFLKETTITYSDQKITIEGDPHYPFLYISAWNLPVLHQRVLNPGEKPIDAELHTVIYPNSYRYSFFDYIEEKSSDTRKEERIQSLFSHIDEIFEYTGKKIEIDEKNKKLRFNDHGRKIPVEYLSSGEKQLLILLFKIFLLKEEPQIILLDEPEISMHLEWQYRLIELIQAIAPKSQLIISTHSPAIFENGWLDKLVFIDDLLIEE